LVIAPRGAMGTLEPLLDLRRRNYDVSALATEDIPDLARLGPLAIKNAIRARHTVAKPIRYVLLVGDTRSRRNGLAALPTHPQGFDVWYGMVTTDNPRARPPALHKPAISVGRFPAASLAELGVMVSKTVDYETRRAPGPWQRRLHAIAGAGNYTPAIDRLIDQVGMAIFAGVVPQPLTVSMTRGLTSSPFCYPPDQFEERVGELFSEGALFVCYVGHGHAQGAMTTTGFLRRTILDCGTVERFACPPSRRPVALFLACNMAEFDRGGDCLAEAALKAPGGPVACVGSVRRSHPYGNAVFGLELARSLFGGQGTLAERLDRARCATVQPTMAFDLLRTSMSGLSRVDSLGGMTGTQQTAELIAHVYLYCVLGDPALPVASPGAIEEFRVAANAGRSGWTVSGRVPGMGAGTALISIEVPRTVIRGRIEAVSPDHADWREVMRRNYGVANNKVVIEWRVPVRAGRFDAALSTGELPAGTYIVKAIAWDKERASAAAASITR